MKTRTIAIYGLDRIGASIGLALKASHLEVTIVGYDKERDNLKAALETGAIDESQWRLPRAARDADIHVISLPAPEIDDALLGIADELHEHALVVDLSSPKVPGLGAARRRLKLGHYVGAVPVLSARSLGDGRRGVAGARHDLFQDSVFCLMPAPEADPEAVETVVNLGTVLGARPFFVDPAEYDNLVLGVETVPGLLAAALFSAVTEATGWRDMLRFADLPFAQATMPLVEDESIALRALNDRAATLRWLDEVLEALRGMRDLVAEGEPEQLAAWLQKLNEEREKWLREREENNWEEPVESDFKPLSMMEHFLGRHGGTTS